MRVPLLVKLPANAHAGRRIETSVSLIDVVPTVLGLLGVERPAALDGVDLLPLVRSASAPPGERPFYLHLDVERADGATHVIRGVLRGSTKYLRRLSPVQEEMLFDVEKDPGERDNRLAADPGGVVGRDIGPLREPRGDHPLDLGELGAEEEARP